MDIERKAYDLYQMDWMSSHGHSVSEIIQAMQEYFVQEKKEGDIADPRECFDASEEFGFKGEIYACFDEFLGAEFQDEEYMEALFSKLPESEKDACMEAYREAVHGLER